MQIVRQTSVLLPDDDLENFYSNTTTYDYNVCAESMGACEINQKDLEKALAVTHPTMTEIIKRLEKKKAVICTQSKVDARYKKINCADEYKNIHIELKKMDWEIFNKICAGIPEEDIQTFLKASEKMLENIEK